jgi:hypothetical protein
MNRLSLFHLDIPVHLTLIIKSCNGFMLFLYFLCTLFINPPKDSYSKDRGEPSVRLHFEKLELSAKKVETIVWRTELIERMAGNAKDVDIWF